MTHPQARADDGSDLGGFGPDEDLFDFAVVVPGPDALDPPEDLDEVFASFRDDPAREELLAVPAAASSKPPSGPGVPASAPLPASLQDSSAPAPAPAATQAPARTPAALMAPTVAREGEPLRELSPPARPSRVSKGVVGIALAVTVLNSALAVVVMRGREPGGDVRAVGETQPASRVDGAYAAPPQATPAHAADAHLPDPEAAGELHAHPALDEARAQISRGEYAAARQRVYGLLAIIDRLEDPRRGALEADCQFLIAQALHLEALARMGGSQ